MPVQALTDDWTRDEEAEVLARAGRTGLIALIIVFGLAMAVGWVVWGLFRFVISGASGNSAACPHDPAFDSACVPLTPVALVNGTRVIRLGIEGQTVAKVPTPIELTVGDHLD